MNNRPLEICPVCCDHFVRAGGGYCSKKCQQAAYNLRKRFAPLRKFLIDMGFSWEYLHGVGVSLTMPQTIRYAYPNSCHDFVCLFGWDTPVWQRDTDYVFKGIEPYLGAPVCSYLHWLYDHRGHYENQLARDLLLAMVKSTLMEASQRFLCGVCERNLIRSEEALYPESMCQDCATMSIPF